MHTIRHLLIRYGIDYDRKPWPPWFPSIEPVGNRDGARGGGKTEILRGVDPAVVLSEGRAVGFVLDADDSVQNTWRAMSRPLREAAASTSGGTSACDPSSRHVSGDTPRPGIPNQTVRRLMYGYLRDAWRDVDVFSVDAYDFSRLVRAMAYEGAWRPALEHLRDAIRRQTGIRDYVDGEKVVHAFLAAHFSLLDVFLIHTEHELNKGYADLYLEPFAARYPGAAFGYVIEVKYLKRNESLDESVVAEKMREAADQVRRYLADEDPDGRSDIDVLVDDRVDVGTEPGGIDVRRAARRLRDDGAGDEAARGYRFQLGYRCPVAGHDHVLAGLDVAQNGRGFVSELPLGDPSHQGRVAVVAQRSNGLRGGLALRPLQAGGFARPSRACLAGRQPACERFGDDLWTTMWAAEPGGGAT